MIPSYRGICARCSARVPKDRNLCPSCGAGQFAGFQTRNGDDGTVFYEDETGSSDVQHHPTGPWDLCFGGGLVYTSTTLIGGDPGVGKSTLFLQMANAFIHCHRRTVLYIAAEETVSQIRPRGKRLGLDTQRKLVFAPLIERGDLNLELAFERHKPGFFIVDSLQAMFGKEHDESERFLKMTKAIAVKYNAAGLISSQVTKTDNFAGLMTFQHEVDALLTFRPEESGTRILRTEKNRNGPANVEVYFEMTAKGLVFVGDNQHKEDNLED